jgi:hypothetical protein
MRPHVPRPAAPHRTVSSAAQCERSLAETWLGPGHPLVRSLSRSETACQQLVAVTVAGVAGVVWFAGGWSFGLSLVVGAAAAQARFACRVALLRYSRRDLCLELIVDGGERLLLRCVERRRRDLLDRRALERLASSIDDLIRAATQRWSWPELVQPLADRRVTRVVAGDLREVASLLRGDPAVQGIALVERLLTSPATPLYGSEVEPLRAELRRARCLLTHG